VLPFSLSGTIGFKLLLNAYTNGPNECILGIGRLSICSNAILTAYRYRWALALIFHRRLAWIRTVLSVSWISSWRLKTVVVGRPSQGTQVEFILFNSNPCVDALLCVIFDRAFHGRHCCCCVDDLLLPTMELSLRTLLPGAVSEDAATSMELSLRTPLPLCFRSVASPAILVRAFVGVIVAAALTMFCFPRWSDCGSLCWSSLWSCCSL
jgi:hypothetical protein